jgi:ketosteroid isomerase-like protein
MHGTCKEIDKVARQIAVDWKDGYNSGNAEQVAALYTEDAYYLTQHFVSGIVKGRANIRAYVQRGVDAKYHVDSIEILATDCSGNMAYSIDRYESTNGGQKAFGVNVVVIKKFADGWRIVAHEAAVPDPATAIQKLTSD